MKGQLFERILTQIMVLDISGPRDLSMNGLFKVN